MDGEAFLVVTAALLLVGWGTWHCKSFINVILRVAG